MAEKERKIRRGEGNVLVAKEPDCELWQRNRGKKTRKIRKGEGNVLVAKEPDCEFWQRKRGKRQGR